MHAEIHHPELYRIFIGSFPQLPILQVTKELKS
jgi:hypothetical protein